VFLRHEIHRQKAIAVELHKLENAGFIREIKASTWVSNPVIVPKKNTDIQRVCVDYTSLYKHCPKDPFPLPCIDQIIDSTAGCTRLSFLDVYSGYNQIKLKKEDKEKAAFITPYGVFCYQVLPFGLKNAGATYQRMMQNCLGSQIGHNIQVYIDDVVITTRNGESLISDLQETFKNLNRYKLKLNPTKCSFGVSAGQLLGFLVTWICPSGTHGLVYRVQPIKEVDRHKDSKMTWRQRRKVLIRIRLGHF
jgi:hypothetical protein